MIFEHFSAIQVGAGRGAVPRYQHIYFLDRSRRKISDFEIIWRGLGDSGFQDQKVQLQAQLKGRVSGVCWSRPVDGRGGAKPEVRAKARAGSLQICDISIFSGNFNWPRNHGETEVKITVKSKI